MLVFAACSNEELPAPAVGDGGSVTFEVALPASAFGRAYGQGLVTKQLHYAVYDANNEEAGAIFASDIPGSPAAENSTIDFTLKLNLVKGKTYDFIFWADAVDNHYYTFSSEKKNVEIDYAAAVGNDDSRDAFFQAVKGVKVTGAMTQPVELRRPFAQLNFGTDDIEAAAAAKTVIKSTAVKVKGVYTKLDLYGGIASDPTTVTFTSDVLPAGQTFPVVGYDYLTMDYLLSGIELEGEGSDADVQSAKREVMDATLTFTFTDGQTADVLVPNMPVQRNYRTNVFGSLITSPMDLDIVVKPGFEDEPGIPVEIVGSKKPATDAEGNILLTNASELAYLASAVNSGSEEYKGKTIKLTKDIDLGSNKMTPIGSYAKTAPFVGVFDGQGFTIKGGIFEDMTGDPSSAALFGYVKGGTIKNLTIDGIKAKSNHYAAGVVGLIHIPEAADTYNTISDVKVINADIRSVAVNNDGGNKVGGIYGYSAYNIHLTNCTVEDSYIQGYREVGGLAGTIGNLNDHRTSFTGNTVKGCTIVQDLSMDYEATTPTTIGALYGKLLNDPIDDTNKAIDVTVGTLAASQDAFTAALKNVKAGEVNDFYLADGEYTLSIPAADGATVNIYGTSKDTKISTNTGACRVQNVNLYNLTVLGKGTYTGFQHLAGEATFTDCVIENYFCGYAPTLKFTDCVFNTSDYALWTYASTDAQFKDCTFNCGGSKSKAILVYVEAANYPGADITIDGCTFNGNGTVAERGVVEIHTETWTANPTGTVKISNSSYNGTFIAWVNELNNGTQEPTNFWTSVITDSTPAE